MSGNPLTSKIADPYVRALFDLSVEKNIMHQITADFQNLDTFLNGAPELLEYINNPTQTQSYLSYAGKYLYLK
jgi:F0F1-type ATP synthase delta subunit